MSIITNQMIKSSARKHFATKKGGTGERAFFVSQIRTEAYRKINQMSKDINECAVWFPDERRVPEDIARIKKFMAIKNGVMSYLISINDIIKRHPNAKYAYNVNEVIPVIIENIRKASLLAPSAINELRILDMEKIPSERYAQVGVYARIVAKVAHDLMMVGAHMKAI